MIRRPPRSTPGDSSAASDVYKRQTPTPKLCHQCYGTVADQHVNLERFYLVASRHTFRVSLLVPKMAKHYQTIGSVAILPVCCQARQPLYGFTCSILHARHHLPVNQYPCSSPLANEPISCSSPLASEPASLLVTPC